MMPIVFWHAISLPTSIQQFSYTFRMLMSFCSFVQYFFWYKLSPTDWEHHYERGFCQICENIIMLQNQTKVFHNSWPIFLYVCLASNHPITFLSALYLILQLIVDMLIYTFTLELYFTRVISDHSLTP